VHCDTPGVNGNNSRKPEKTTLLMVLKAGTAAAAMFMIATFLPSSTKAMTVAALTELSAIIPDAKPAQKISFYYRPDPHVYGPYYEYAYRPFWKYRIYTYRPHRYDPCRC
jgi:hypothetical protein